MSLFSKLPASAGAALHLPILAGMSLAILLTQFKIAGIRTLASSVREKTGPSAPVAGAQLYPERERRNAAPHLGNHDASDASAVSPLLAPWQIDWCQPIALLVGNEGAGLPEEIERSADARIHIPMSSGVESLNAAAAAAVVFYEAARQRNSVSASNIQQSGVSRLPGKS